MLTRTSLVIGATVLAALAGVVASLDGDTDILPFFVGLTVAGGIGALAVREPYSGRRQVAAQAIGGLWLIAAGWIGVLLVMHQAACGCSYPVRPPEETYLGLTATIYHLAGVYLGGALMAVAAFSRRLSPA
jgi:hypothetical protein